MVDRTEYLEALKLERRNKLLAEIRGLYKRRENSQLADNARIADWIARHDFERCRISGNSKPSEIGRG